MPRKKSNNTVTNVPQIPIISRKYGRFVLIGDKVKAFFSSIAPYALKVWRVFFPKMSPKENIFQYLVRQLLVCDSRGNPSITTTILYYAMIIVAVVVWVEVKIALSVKEVIDPTTRVVTKTYVGFNSEFIWLVLVLVTIITAYAQARSKRIANGGSDNGGGVVDTAIDVIKRIRGGSGS